MKRRSRAPQGGDRPADVTPEQVVAHLATISKPATIREIAHALGLKHGGRRYLPRIVQQLKRKGEIEEEGNRFRLRGWRRPKQSTADRKPTTTSEVRKRTLKL